ncbi:MAG TPA: hypothetical protein VF043_33045 [Ktedonobacteraceae bacterium]
MGVCPPLVSDYRIRRTIRDAQRLAARTATPAGVRCEQRLSFQNTLLQDFQRYSDKLSDDLAIDWSDTCPEGHTTEYLDGYLENWSGVWVVTTQGERIAWGWMDFIHGGGDNPLFVFWYYLHFGANTQDVVRAHGIPQHIWESLPESSKDLCLTSETYDATWRNDPLVLQWRNQRSQS